MSVTALSLAGLAAKPLTNYILGLLIDKPEWADRVSKARMVAGDIAIILEPAVEAAIAEELQAEMERVAADPVRAEKQASINRRQARLLKEIAALEAEGK